MAITENMVPIYRKHKEVLLADFMLTGISINSKAYGKTLRKLKNKNKDTRKGMLTRNMSLVHDNARPHATLFMQDLLTSLG